VRAALRARREIALVDLREEHAYAQAHPLFAVQLSPRRDVPVVLYDAGDGGEDDSGAGLVEPAAERLRALGWTDVRR
jgi:hypothetical protein